MFLKGSSRAQSHVGAAQLKKVPDTSSLDFNPESYRGQQGDKSEERAQKHQKAADTYNKVTTKKKKNQNHVKVLPPHKEGCAHSKLVSHMPDANQMAERRAP